MREVCDFEVCDFDVQGIDGRLCVSESNDSYCARIRLIKGATLRLRTAIDKEKLWGEDVVQVQKGFSKRFEDTGWRTERPRGNVCFLSLSAIPFGGFDGE